MDHRVDLVGRQIEAVEGQGPIPERNRLILAQHQPRRNRSVFARFELHRRMIRVLRLIRQLIDDTHTPEPSSRTALGDCFRYLSDYPSRVHHPREEAIFDILVSRDANARTAVEALNREHEVMDRNNGQILALLEDSDWGDQPDVTIRIAPLVNRHINQQIHHMRTEEGIVFPLVDKVLLMSDWKSVIREHGPRQSDRAMPGFPLLDKLLAGSVGSVPGSGPLLQT